MSGPFGSTAWMYSSGGGAFYGHEISNSLRFNDDDSPDLRKTPSSASNRKTWTWSCWVKRSEIVTGAGPLFSAGTNSGGYIWFVWSQNRFYFQKTQSSAFELLPTMVFRDPSAWYHIVVAVDTTQSTESNRVKIYVNGNQQTVFTTESYPSLNANLEVNSSTGHYFNRNTDGNTFGDHYLADVNFIDGQALTPSSFGETKNDIWIPKDTADLTFGTNGFRLEFKQTGTGTASSSTIGADTSGNDNHWTSNNLAAHDVVLDSPTNNFSTWNPIALDTLNIAFSEGNLQAVKASDSASPTTRSTFGMTQGSWYWETRLEAFAASGGTVYGVGIDTDETDQGDSDNNYNTVRFIVGAAVGPVHQKTTNGSFGGNVSYGTNASNGDIIGVKLDIDNEVVAFSRNGTFFADISLPALGKTYFASNLTDQGSNTYTAQINFGQDSTFAGNETAQGNADENGIGDFYYAPPSGSLALCTANLPDPVAAIDPAQGGSPQDYFNTVLYTGNATARSISGVGFQPDWVWIKERSGTSNHMLFDSVRGAGERLISDTTNAELTDTNRLSSFDSDGFSLGTNNAVNENTETYASWNWKAGTSFSNDASSTSVGSIDSAGSVSADTGFSIISYTGTGSAGTIAHGLGVAPDMILVKARSAVASWQVYHAGVASDAETDYLVLNTTAAAVDNNTVWNDTAPTTSVFSIGTASGVNTDGNTLIAYCFAGVDGYSKFGAYTGNGSTDGTFVYTGFRPAFVIVKRTNSAYAWHILDIERNVLNPMDKYLNANTNVAEQTHTFWDFVSNGFKIRNTGASYNADGGTYIYMAFAEQPFKYANAR